MVENAFGISVSRFWVPLVTMEQRPRVVRDIVYTMCGVASQDKDLPGWGRHRVPNPGNDGVAIQNNQVTCVSNKNYRNPSG